MTDVDLQWAGVDYIRLWLDEAEAEAVGGADAVWVKALSIAGLRAEKARPHRWRMGAAEGWLLSGVGVAVSDEGAIIAQVAGGAAGSFLSAMEGVGRPSRIDVQCTVKPATLPGVLLEQELQALREQEGAWPHRGRAPKVWWIVSDAMTVYSGKRGNNGAMMRIYDSEAVHLPESEAYRGTVRYEVEATGKRAWAVYDAIGGSNWEPTKVEAVVKGDMRHRGCRAHWSGAAAMRVGPVVPLQERSNEKSLQWIRKQVRPTIRRLLEDNVSLSSVLEALGLEEPATDAGTPE